MKILVFGIHSFSLCGSFYLISKDTSQFCPSHSNGHLIADNLSLHNVFSANLCSIRIPSCKICHRLAWVMFFFGRFFTIVCLLHLSVNIVSKILRRHLLAVSEMLTALWHCFLYLHELLVSWPVFICKASLTWLSSRLSQLLYVSEYHFSSIGMGALFHYWALECTGHCMNLCPKCQSCVRRPKLRCIVLKVVHTHLENGQSIMREMFPWGSLRIYQIEKGHGNFTLEFLWLYVG